MSPQLCEVLAEEKWKQDPLYEFFEMQRQACKLPFQSLTDKKRNLAHDANLPSPPLEDELDRTDEPDR